MSDHSPAMSGRRKVPVVLMIEDNPADRDLLSEAWRDYGLPVRFLVADTSEQAFTLLQDIGSEERPDLILIDINIPSMNGHDILGTLKADPRWSAIPMVVWTSSATAADSVRSLSSGAGAHVVKPRTFEGCLELVPLLRAFLPSPLSEADS